MFAHRREAGQKLARALLHHQGKNPLVLGIPRGGVPIAREIADLLGGELDVIIPRKVGLPWHRELAAGAVTMDGSFLLNHQVARMHGVSEGDLAEEVRRAREEIKRRMVLYRGDKPLPDFQGRTVILTDDGVATGFTMRAALKDMREKKVEHLVLAVPVAPPDTVKVLKQEADELVCLSVPSVFYAVGQFYRDFSQLTDREVMEMMKQEKNQGRKGVEE